MQVREIRLRNTQGLHARVAARVVKVAGRFKSRIVLAVGERRASARSIMAVMMLAAAMGPPCASRSRGRTSWPRSRRSPRSLASPGERAERALPQRAAHGGAVITFALHGIGVSAGIAIGRAQLISHATLEVAHYTVPANRVDQEIARLDFAVDEVQKELTTLHGTMMRDGELPGEFGAFLDVHWMILNDPTLAEAPKRIIAEQRCNAEWALVQQMNVLIDQFDQIEDAYLRERKNDVVQVVERVLKRLMGKPGSLPTPVAEERTILVAHDLSPADVIQFKTHHFAAFLTDLGGVTSHTAIVARSLSVPAVVATHNARQMIRDGEMLIVDGSSHVVIVNPDRAVLAEYRLKQSEFELARQKLKRLRGKPAETLDGHRVVLNANIELPGDLAQVLDSGANGVGLFRSEFLFLNRDGLPSEDEQFEAYRAVAAGLAGKPVTIRTFDLGADKHEGRPRGPRARRAQPGARAARGALLPRRAAALPDPAPRDPARVALRQGAHPDPDARRRSPRSTRRSR
jgi:phosphotransferase system enzyme I (PtsI)